MTDEIVEPNVEPKPKKGWSVATAWTATQGQAWSDFTAFALPIDKILDTIKEDNSMQLKKVNSSTVMKDKVPLVSDTKVGLEFEMEGMSKFINFIESGVDKFKYVRGVIDHSLRDYGIEVVFKAGFKGDDIYKALEEVDSIIQTFNPKFSHRTSVHVHVDLSNLSPKQIVNFCIASIILERVLNRYLGMKRDNNIFCLPYYRASGRIIDTLLHMSRAQDRSTIKKISANAEQVRYAGINMASIAKHGTLEFRHHPGTGDMYSVLNWVNLLLSIREWSTSDQFDLNSLPLTFSGSTPESFMESVFKEDFVHLMYDGIYEDLLKGVRLAQDIIYYSQLTSGSSKIVKSQPRVQGKSLAEKLFKQ